MSAFDKTATCTIVMTGLLADELKAIIRDEFLFVGEGLIGVRDLDPDELRVETISHVERGQQLLELADGVLWGVSQSDALVVHGRKRCILAAELLSTLRKFLEKERDGDEVDSAHRDMLGQRIARIRDVPELDTEYWAE